MGTLNCTNVNATQVTVGTGGVAFQDGSSMTSAQTGTLNDLNNVSAGSPSTGQFLQWNGSNWVNATVQQGIESGTRSQRPSSNQLTPFRWNTETQVQLEAQFIWYSRGKDLAIQASSYAPLFIHPYSTASKEPDSDYASHKVTDDNYTTQTYRNDCTLQHPYLTAIFRKR